jgi:hypothetical protein
MYNIRSDDSTYSPITIRPADREDLVALGRLAQLDSRPVPEGELLVALVGGEAQAAISLPSGQTIADPFQRTAELVGMLTMSRSRLRGKARPRRGLKGLLGKRGSSAPQPAGTLRPYARRTGA